MACLLTISPEFSGHLYPAVALQVELRARGHDVRMIGREGGEIIPQQQGVPYEIVDTELFSRSRIEEFINCIGNRDFSESFNASREFHLETAKAYVRSLPTILERIAPDLLIVDQTLLCVGAIADVFPQ